MTVQAVKTALQALLNANASTDFFVIGAQSQGINSEDVYDRPMVQVFLSQTDFDESRSPRIGKVTGLATFRIELTIASPSIVDVATLDDPTSTQGQIAAALAASFEAMDVADAAMDNLYSKVWNILHNPQNRNFGIDPSVFQVSDNWIPTFRKGAPLQRGEVVVISANLSLQCKIVEYPQSATEVPGLAIDTVINATIDRTAVPADGIAATFGNPPTSPKYDPARQGAKVGT